MLLRASYLYNGDGRRGKEAASRKASAWSEPRRNPKWRLFKMANLFDLKKDRQEALTAADALLTKAETAKRDLSAEEKTLFDDMAEVTRLNVKIEPIESQNTLSKMFNANGPAFLFDAGRARTTEPKHGINGAEAPKMAAFD